MPRRGKRKRLARGIYQDHAGRAAVVTVGDWRREKRFPPHTPLAIIRRWQEDTRVRLRGCGQSRPTRGTLAAEVDRYLALVRHLAGWISLRAELRAWVRLHPTLPRYQVTAAHVLDARNTWLEAGLTPKTINNRVAALNRLWHQLDGRRAASPCDDLRPLAVHKSPIVSIAPQLVVAVYTQLVAREQQGLLRDRKTRARFMVYASTGKRPSEIMRAEPSDVDLERRVWIVRDGKGGWSPGIYLNGDMLAAWRLFAEADAWGPFREGAFVRSLRAAGWPAGVRPYHLRHTVGMTMSERGVDLADIQQHMGHSRIDTTRKHYVPVLGSRLQLASELLDGRFGWDAPESASPPTAPLESTG
jgi:integrase